MGAADVAILAKKYNIMMVSPQASSTELSKKARYPYFFRLVAADTGQAVVWVALCDKFGWSAANLVVLHEDDLSIQVADTVVQVSRTEFTGIEMNRLTRVSSTGVLGYIDVATLLQSITASRLRINLLSVYDVTLVRRIVCQAFLSEIPAFFVVFGCGGCSLATGITEAQLADAGCTRAQFTEAVRGVVSVSQNNVGRSDTQRDPSGLLPSEWEIAYKDKLALKGLEPVGFGDPHSYVSVRCTHTPWMSDRTNLMSLVDAAYKDKFNIRTRVH